MGDDQTKTSDVFPVVALRAADFLLEEAPHVTIEGVPRDLSIERDLPEVEIEDSVLENRGLFIRQEVDTEKGLEDIVSKSFVLVFGGHALSSLAVWGAIQALGAVGEQMGRVNVCIVVAEARGVVVALVDILVVMVVMVMMSQNCSWMVNGMQDRQLGSVVVLVMLVVLFVVEMVMLVAAV